MGVANCAFPRPPPPPLRDDEASVRGGQIRDEPTLSVEDLRADRDAHLGVVAVGAVLPAAATASPTPAPEMPHAP